METLKIQLENITVTRSFLIRDRDHPVISSSFIVFEIKMLHATKNQKHLFIFLLKLFLAFSVITCEESHTI